MPVEENKAFTVGIHLSQVPVPNPAADTESLVIGAECSGAWESPTVASALPRSS